MAINDKVELCAWERSKCYEQRVSGSKYCEDHFLQSQSSVQSAISSSGGTLAEMIRRAAKQGLLQPIQSGYQHEIRATA